ncbi:hypothetical protein KLP40_11620 [Hymenobacter sp. NST-14]|uniref:hypothetical protein n=1 Tax=Hymenobacter piscis TaxID=2839984 RepID=UPI001C0212DC|nr:hypothetical protein [Hymenobacter piscis]MBT9393811.1 hypothetical protein [Hymenobacter piscis]
MDTLKPTQPTSDQLPKDEAHLLPKIEDVVALTGLFTPSQIIEELHELEKLEAREEGLEPGETGT